MRLKLARKHGTGHSVRKRSGPVRNRGRNLGNFYDLGRPVWFVGESRKVGDRVSNHQGEHQTGGGHGLTSRTVALPGKGGQLDVVQTQNESKEFASGTAGAESRLGITSRGKAFFGRTESRWMRTSKVGARDAETLIPMLHVGTLASGGKH